MQIAQIQIMQIAQAMCILAKIALQVTHAQFNLHKFNLHT